MKKFYFKNHKNMSLLKGKILEIYQFPKIQCIKSYYNYQLVYFIKEFYISLQF